MNRGHGVSRGKVIGIHERIERELFAKTIFNALRASVVAKPAEDNESEDARMPRTGGGGDCCSIAESDCALAHLGFGQSRAALPDRGGTRYSAANRNFDGSAG